MKTDYNELLEELFGFERAGIKPGLSRINELLSFIKNPEKEFKSIHVAGTNGKGSVCNLLASILQESGMKVGLYTSPHLLKFNERIKINGKDISDDEIVKILSSFLTTAKNIGATFFEITTAIAFEHFKRNNIDVAIIECGMGGQFDSTNVINPILTIITQIDLDHQEYLGNSLELIAEAKAGIIKKNVPAIINNTHSELKQIFVEKASNELAPMIYIDDTIKCSNININENLEMICDIYDGVNNYTNIKMSIAGIHQVQNLKTIIIAYNFLKFVFPLNEDILYRGLSNVKENTNFNSRIDLISRDPKIIIDVAHNPAGVEYLVETIKLSPLKDVKFNIYFAAMKDKDIHSILTHLLPITNELNILNLSNKRAANVKEVYKYARDVNFSKIKIWDFPEEAFENIINDSIICGSFHTVEAYYNSQKR